MPAWVLMALKLIAGGAVSGAAFEVGGRSLAQVDDFRGPQFPTALSPGILSTQGVRLNAHGIPIKRRRRRRALTASDRADIAFIAGLLGPAAGSKFAAIIGAK